MLGARWSRGRRTSAWLLALAFLGLAAPPASAEVVLRAFPSTGNPVSVNQHLIPSSLRLVNNSTSPHHTVGWTLSSIRLAPSCGATSIQTCTTPDVGVLTAAGPGAGRAGTVCAGTTFAFSAPDSAGVITLTPSSPVTLGTPASECIVDFTMDAQRMPNVDASGLPGVQTLMVGYLTAMSTSGGITTNSQANTTVTVVPYDPDPVADFNGDGDTDHSLYRGAGGIWYLRNIATIQWGGEPQDKAVPGDYNGDGDLDVAVFRGGTWYVNDGGAITVQQWGDPTDIPVPGDYNGDLDTDFAVYRPSNRTWYVNDDGAVTIVQWGDPTDVPVPADYNSDGRTDFAVYRPSSGVWYVRNVSTTQWGGASGDWPVPGDYNGDGDLDVAVFRPSDRRWYVNDGGTVTVTQWGDPTDIPVPGDYNGDGDVEPAVYRNGTWYVNDDGAVTVTQWGGEPSDDPLPLPSSVRDF